MEASFSWLLSFFRLDCSSLRSFCNWIKFVKCPSSSIYFSMIPGYAFFSDSIAALRFAVASASSPATEIRRWISCLWDSSFRIASSFEALYLSCTSCASVVRLLNAHTAEAAPIATVANKTYGFFNMVAFSNACAFCANNILPRIINVAAEWPFSAAVTNITAVLYVP